MSELNNHSPPRHAKDLVAEEGQLSSGNKSDGPSGPRLVNQVKPVVKSTGGAHRRLSENERL